MIDLINSESWLPLIEVLLSVYGTEWVHVGSTALPHDGCRIEKYVHAISGRLLTVDEHGRCYVRDDGAFVEVTRESALQISMIGAEVRYSHHQR